MHNAAPGPGAKATTGRGQSVQPWTNVTNMYLLQGSDQSSTCLICHGSGQQVAGAQFTIADLDIATGAAPSNYTPGGDFGWLGLTFPAATGGVVSPGAKHGHSVVAADYPQFTPDTMLRAPGGSFTASTGTRAFGCANCHDPHGRYRLQDEAGVMVFRGPTSPGDTLLPIAASGSYGDAPVANTYAVGAYRLLGGQNYAPASNPSYPFPNDPPVAVAPTTYNRLTGEAGGGANEMRVAYGRGMSEWCQNCHTNIHLDGYTTGVAGLRHPAGSEAFLHAGQIEVYNSYVSSGNMSRAAGQDSYTSLVPFEQTGLTIAQLADAANQRRVITADETSAVMCLSCHRAHASAFDQMVRWDQNATFLTNGTAITSGLSQRSDAQNTAGYYGRSVAQLGTYQRSLCNKCHGKD